VTRIAITGGIVTAMTTIVAAITATTDLRLREIKVTRTGFRPGQVMLTDGKAITRNDPITTAMPRAETTVVTATDMGISKPIAMASCEAMTRGTDVTVVIAARTMAGGFPGK
jgi:hypothetical protein